MATNAGFGFKNKTGKEKILFTRSKQSQNSPIVGKADKKEGVLVVDPNRVVNEYNEVVDRYVKQEDLVMYCSLQVFKRPELAIVDSGGTRNVHSENAPIQINFLNPLKTTATTGQQGTYKGAYTTQWTDFFTSDAANSPGDPNYVLDPESFGISDIDFTVNASHTPRITIRFIDVQGRMLFERGNDPNNPYNIFFTYPYPNFLLTFKGYYGKAVQVPLVLFKSNTSFDPNTGNYEITAEFQSEIFSVLNSFITMYAYVAPYMFPTGDGSFLGKKILKSLYERQNKAIKDSLKNETEFAKYNITNSPTLYDLANAIKNIPFSSLDNTSQTNSTGHQSDTILNIKYTIEQYNQTIIEYFGKLNQYTPQLKQLKGGVAVDYPVYKPISNSFEFDIQNQSPNDIFDYMQRINEAIAQIKTLNTDTSNYSDSVVTFIKSNSELKNNVPGYLNTVTIDNIINPKLFYFNGNDKLYTLNDYNLVIEKVMTEIDSIQSQIEDKYTDNKIVDIGKSLGYQPTLSNVLRIIANNMQTFLILLEITAQNAVNQMSQDPVRVLKHKEFTTYKSNVNNSIHYYSPFPNYYKSFDETSGNDILKRQVLAYPGADPNNNNWFEVAFVDEIYNGVQRVMRNTDHEDGSTAFGTKKTGLSTLFPLGEIDLSVYENKTNANDIICELITKYNLHAAYSGIYYRGINPTAIKTSYSESVANFEFKLLDELIFNNIRATNTKIVISNNIKDALAVKSGYATNLANFAYNYIKLKGGKDTYNKILAESKEEAKLYNPQVVYTKEKFDNIIKKKNDIVNGNISNKAVFNNLYNTVRTPAKYSISNGNGKVKNLAVYADLQPNISYYCDTQTNDLSNIITATNNVENYENVFQGFTWNMNKMLQGLRFNTNFNDHVSFANSDVPALTYNTKLADNNAFKPVEKTDWALSARFKQFI